MEKFNFVSYFTQLSVYAVLLNTARSQQLLAAQLSKNFIIIKHKTLINCS
jgi:hypothetical protein